MAIERVWVKNINENHLASEAIGFFCFWSKLSPSIPIKICNDATRKTIKLKVKKVHKKTALKHTVPIKNIFYADLLDVSGEIRAIKKKIYEDNSRYLLIKLYSLYYKYTFIVRALNIIKHCVL